jgi:hypothetical protein
VAPGHPSRRRHARHRLIPRPKEQPPCPATFTTTSIPSNAPRAAAPAPSWAGWSTPLVFVAVNLLLAAVAASAGRGWAIYPAIGWSIGLAAHGVLVFFLTGGAGLYEQLLQRERPPAGAEDPW